ncbi:MAG: TetR family transcriptional regulator C-terminal domain-containing protein [Steroidobacteraceae bacterium]
MPKAVDHDQRREQIAQAACVVVANNGFEQATVVRIARAAGYTTGMLPHYFASKQDIIRAALRLSLMRIEARLDDAGSQGQDLLAVLTEALPLDKPRFTECAFWTAFWGQVSTDAEARRINAWVHREYAKLFRKCIATHWPQSAQWPPALRAQVLASIMTFINGLTASAVTSPADWPAARQVEQLGLQLQMLKRWAERAGRAEPVHLPRRRQRGARAVSRTR